MVTFLDLLVVVVMALVAAAVVAVALMFLVKNARVRKVCLYFVAALGLYIGYVGLRIHFPGFMPQMVLAVLFALVGVGALVLHRLYKDDEKKFLLARILASVALLAGMFNAFS